MLPPEVAFILTFAAKEGPDNVDINPKKETTIIKHTRFILITTPSGNIFVKRRIDELIGKLNNKEGKTYSVCETR